MRFPRQAKIFRGQLDAAPVAGVVFLLLIFLVLGSLIYTPGVLVNLNNPAATIRIAKDGRFHFGSNSYTESETNLLRAALRNSAAGPPFVSWRTRASRRKPRPVSAILSIVFLPSGLPPAPPGCSARIIPPSRSAVNFLGQYFYDNQLVGERELKAAFTKRMRPRSRIPGIDLDCRG